MFNTRLTSTHLSVQPPFFPTSLSILFTLPEYEGEYITVFTDVNSKKYLLFLILYVYTKYTVICLSNKA